MLSVGFCGLLGINGALKTGHVTVKWKVQFLLRSFYKLFRDSPARRADYINWAESELFLNKLCSVGWIENVDVCQKSISCI